MPNPPRDRKSVEYAIERFLRAIEQPGSAAWEGSRVLLALRFSVAPGGRRYAKVMVRERHDYDHRDPDEKLRERIYAFVDLTNGDLLKPEGWRKPALHPRGNLFDPDGGMAGVNWYGPKYLSDPTLPARYRVAGSRD
jgi:hypothetical protein